MPVDKKELERAYVQLRRIAEHREVGAEKEIRRIYKALLADLKQFIGAEYADKGNLTYEILQAKGEYARFLEEIQRRCDNITTRMEREITDLVNDVYRAVYDGTVAAVQKTAGPERLDAELRGLQSATPEVIRRAVENPVAGLTLKDTLEKRRQDIIYDIKRNIGVGLAIGDRVDTMARRIAQSLDGDYKKSIRIARTEAHRVRESGMHDAARQVDAAIKDSGADMRMVKTWHTMKDERVRPNHRVKTKHGWKTYVGGKANHQKMEGVTVLADEQFTLSDGSKTDAPGNSGVASQDINCRCFVEYSLMTDEEFFKATGRHFPLDKSENHDIIKSGGDYMSLEYQRYGRNKETLINNTYIDSGEYRRKFDKITDNPDVNRTLYYKAKEMLKHRSGTTLEDMYWIDGNTGAIIAKEISSTEARAIKYSEATKQTVSDYKQKCIIAIHTHPESMPPSVADFNSCYANKYMLGCVACHDGKLFVYTSSENLNERLYNMYIEIALKDGATEYEAQISALNELKRNYKINFWEV